MVKSIKFSKKECLFCGISDNDTLELAGFDKETNIITLKINKGGKNADNK